MMAHATELLAEARNELVAAAKAYAVSKPPTWWKTHDALFDAALYFAALETQFRQSWNETEFPTLTLCARRMADALRRNDDKAARDWLLKMPEKFLEQAGSDRRQQARD